MRNTQFAQKIRHMARRRAWLATARRQSLPPCTAVTHACQTVHGPLASPATRGARRCCTIRPPSAGIPPGLDGAKNQRASTASSEHALRNPGVPPPLQPCLEVSAASLKAKKGAASTAAQNQPTLVSGRVPLHAPNLRLYPLEASGRTANPRAKQRPQPLHNQAGHTRQRYTSGIIARSAPMHLFATHHALIDDSPV